MGEHERRERLALLQLQQAALGYSHGDATSEEVITAAVQYASAVRERRVNQETQADKLAMLFDRRARGEA